MEKHLTRGTQFEWKSLQRVVIVRSLPGLGDFLCAVPALRAIRTALPDAHLSLVGLSQAKPWVQRFHTLLDEWLPFPGFPGIPEVEVQPEKVSEFLGDIQNRHIDLALQMHGSGLYMNRFTMLLGAEHSAGFYPAELDCPNPQCFIPYPETQPEVRRHLQLVKALGIPLQGEHLEFPIMQADRQEFEAIALRHSLRHAPYICLHAGASTPDRRWPVPQFAEVADTLAAEGFLIVLTGTQSEVRLAAAIADQMKHASVNLAGRTSLGAMAVLLQNSSLLVCNDTGVSHLAAALQVPSVVIFCNSDPQRWAPLDAKLHRAVCSGVMGSPPTTEMVLSEALDQLHQEVCYAS